jgi:hypothetical protein
MIATLPTATAPVAAFSVPFNGSVDAQAEAFVDVQGALILSGTLEPTAEAFTDGMGTLALSATLDAQMEGALVGVVQYANVMQTVRAMDWSAPAVSVADFSAPAWGARGEYDQ